MGARDLRAVARTPAQELRDARERRGVVERRSCGGSGEGDSDDLGRLRDLAFQLMAATRQVAMAGDPQQVKAAQEVANVLTGRAPRNPVNPEALQVRSSK